jgi:hypothetical protein
LVLKRLHRKRRERRFRHTVRCLRIRNPNHRVVEIYLILLIDINSLYTRRPVSVMIRTTFRRCSGAWNSNICLLRPRHIVRPNRYRKLNACTRIRRQEFLPHRDVQYPELLTYCCGLEDSELSKTVLCLHAGVFLEPSSRILLDVSAVTSTRRHQPNVACRYFIARSLASRVFGARLGARVVLHEGV